MANAASSRTDACLADVITHVCAGRKEGTFLKEGTHMLVKYAKGGGTSATITVTVINPKISATDEYKPIYLSGTVVLAQTFFFDTSGNYRVPLALGLDEKTIKATVAFTGGTDQTMVVDFADD